MIHRRCSYLSYFIILLFFTFLFHCGNAPTKNDTTVNPPLTAKGSLEVRVHLKPLALAKSKIIKQTTVDSLVVEITALDMEKIHYARKIDVLRPINVDTIKNLTIGDNRNVTIWTVDKNDNVINIDSIESHMVTIQSDNITQISTTLIPIVGSIFIQLIDIPTKVDSILAEFIDTAGNRWSSEVGRSTRVNISLDNIKHLTKGNLRVFGIDSTKDTLYRSSTNLVFNARSPGNIHLEFSSNPGSLQIGATIESPAATLAVGLMSDTDSNQTENGKLIITEIMYAANNSEYIEVYNPGSDTLNFDTLLVGKDNVYKKISNIVFPPKSFLTIGRDTSYHWINKLLLPESFFDLSSTGNWISLKTNNNELLDRVCFVGGSNSLEWPNVNGEEGKRAIILDSLAYDPILNNFGKYWYSAPNRIRDTSSQYGSPGVK